jgi:hypothetical protein
VLVEQAYAVQRKAIGTAPAAGGEAAVEPPGPARHGPATVVCRVAHGPTPIDAAARGRTSINTLLAWQKLGSSRSVAIQFS